MVDETELVVGVGLKLFVSVLLVVDGKLGIEARCLLECAPIQSVCSKRLRQGREVGGHPESLGQRAGTPEVLMVQEEDRGPAGAVA